MVACRLLIDIWVEGHRIAEFDNESMSCNSRHGEGELLREEETFEDQWQELPKEKQKPTSQKILIGYDNYTISGQVPLEDQIHNRIVLKIREGLLWHLEWKSLIYESLVRLTVQLRFK